VPSAGSHGVGQLLRMRCQPRPAVSLRVSAWGEHLVRLKECAHLVGAQMRGFPA
jgi:hypothetical protein